MTAALVNAEIRDRVLYVRIDREAKRNALSLDVLDEIRGAFERHADEATLIAAVVTGAGSRCFAAGGDLEELDAVRDEAAARAMSARAHGALDAMRRFPVPVIAALNGDALGGGAEFALACDMRVFAAHARLAYVQGRLSVSPAWGGGVDLMRLLGTANALRMLCRGDLIDASEAMALGLAQAVAAESESIEAATERFLEPIRRLRPQVARAFKALSGAARDGATAGELREVELAALMQTWLHDDHWQAAAAVQAGIAAKR